MLKDRDMHIYVATALDGSTADMGEDTTQAIVAEVVDRLKAQHGLVDLDAVPGERFWDVVQSVILRHQGAVCYTEATDRYEIMSDVETAREQGALRDMIETAVDAYTAMCIMNRMTLPEICQAADLMHISYDRRDRSVLATAIIRARFDVDA